MRTALLRQHHHEIASIINDMRRNLLAPQRMSLATAEGLRANMDVLATKFNVHLSIEDKGLYPKLNAVPSIAPTAHKFAKEMVDIAAAFREFLSHWETGERIHAEPSKFVDECTTVFHTLARRIEREEKELYPQADALP